MLQAVTLQRGLNLFSSYAKTNTQDLSEMKILKWQHYLMRRG